MTANQGVEVHLRMLLLLFTDLAYSETDVPPLLQVQNGHFITTADSLPVTMWTM